jgi:hypothetical protein
MVVANIWSLPLLKKQLKLRYLSVVDDVIRKRGYPRRRSFRVQTVVFFE